jgi:deoxyribodipyrimidine photo-lyase
MKPVVRSLPSALSFLTHDPRVRIRNESPLATEGRAVVYWMQRAQRAQDNPALDVAVRAANELAKPLVVFFGLTPHFPNANERHYAFLLEGLVGTAREIEKRGAVFCLRVHPRHELTSLCDDVSPALVVGDENPLREPEAWRREAARRLGVLFVTVDADVIVPSAFFAKEEHAARTLRPKIERELPRFLVPSEEARVRVPFAGPRPEATPLELQTLLRELPLDRSARAVTTVRSGTAAGVRALEDFLLERLADYPDARNRPEKATGTSLLSAYLHFGQLGPRDIALAVLHADAPVEAKEAYLEQLVVRRELAVNFVARNPNYDRYEGLPDWARATLERHASDPRPHVYSADELEAARTHDPLWNAAQLEMVLTGWMHGYVRMYWAKKILEWSEHPAAALDTAIRLNDKYFLDGRDPNGYTNIAWAIGGKHDRPWPERAVFGKVRSMTYASTSRKFDAAGYIQRVSNSFRVRTTPSPARRTR